MLRIWELRMELGEDFLTREKLVFYMKLWTRQCSRLAPVKLMCARLRPRSWVRKHIRMPASSAMKMTRIVFTCPANIMQLAFDAAKTLRNVRFADSRLTTLWEFIRIDQFKQIYWQCDYQSRRHSMKSDFN